MLHQGHACRSCWGAGLILRGTARTSSCHCGCHADRCQLPADGLHLLLVSLQEVVRLVRRYIYLLRLALVLVHSLCMQISTQNLLSVHCSGRLGRCWLKGGITCCLRSFCRCFFTRPLAVECWALASCSSSSAAARSAACSAACICACCASTRAACAHAPDLGRREEPIVGALNVSDGKLVATVLQLCSPASLTLAQQLLIFEELKSGVVSIQCGWHSPQIAAPCTQGHDHSQHLMLMCAVVALSSVEAVAEEGDGLHALALVLLEET